MTKPSPHDQHLGVVIVSFKRSARRRLPRLKRIKAAVDGGACLTQWQIDYLARVMQDTHDLAPEFNNYPEIQGIYCRIVSLYHDITERAVLNEQQTRADD